MFNAYNNAQSVFNYQKQMREYFHKYPELSGLEELTFTRLVSELKKMQVDFSVVDDYSIIAYINYSPKNESVALRCMIDALPVDEKTDLEFKSVYTNIAHSAGNDLSMAIGLGILKILKEHESKLRKSVCVIFESNSATYSQSEISNSKYLKNTKYLYAMFGLSELKVNEVSVNPAQKHVGTEYITLKWYGNSSPSGFSYAAEDTLMAASIFTTQVRSYLANLISPEEIYYVTVTKTNSGFFHNMTSEFTEQELNVRFANFDTRKKVHEGILKLVESLKTNYNLNVSMTINDVVAPFEDDYEVGSFAMNSITRLQDYFKVVPLNTYMYSTTFSRYLENFKGSILLYGVGHGDKEKDYSIFSGKYNPDEQGMLVATAWFLQIVKDFNNQ